jgi:hypothetical protein
MNAPRQYRAGQSVEDYCRQCHEDRIHTVIVVDAHAQPLRVTCDFCRSEHNFRGGARSGTAKAAPYVSPAGTAKAAPHVPPAGTAKAVPYESPSRNPLPLVSEREKQAPPMVNTPGSDDLELLLRRVIREETGLTPVAPAEKWRGGDLVLRPGKPGVQEKSWPIESFFHKVVMLRNRLRTLEQQVNASDLPDDQKLKIQSHITGCYGSLTSFNVLFADEDDRFVGTSQE